ncbi:MAG: hypothetical protein ACTSYX_11930 [Candidatus Thorarchaeota archaeon]
MTFVIPAAVNLHTTDWDLDGRSRGAYTEGQWSTRNTKGNGNMPLTSSAMGFVNTTTTSFQGVFSAFLASGGYNVATDTRVMAFTYQYNAPNRLEIETVANNGIVMRLGSGGASPPANTRTFQVGGQNTALGKAREFPVHIIIDLNADSYEASTGTFSNADVQCYGLGSKTLNMGGTTTQVFVQRCFVFETTKNATNIPRFTGASDWDDVIVAMGTAFDTKITHGWLAREGTVFSIACPWEIGDNSTSTQFDDNGVSVFWPDDDEPGNPKVRVTEQAFRAYLNLRNNAADTVTLSGKYDCGNSYPPWDFDQDDAAVVTFSSPVFKRVGTFLVGSSITGAATFDDCGVVTYQDNGVDLDGSTFKNPHADHLVRLEA